MNSIRWNIATNEKAVDSMSLSRGRRLWCLTPLSTIY